MNDEIGVVGAHQMIVNPIGLVVLLLCIAIVLFARRSFVIPAVLILVFAIPSAQRMVIFSLEFSFLRIIILTALLRMQLRDEGKHIRLSRPDIFLLLWMVWSVFAYGVLNSDFHAAIARIGYMIEAVGGYFVGRAYVRSWEDMRRIALFLGYASIPVLVFFLIERATGRNMFSAFGGVLKYTLVREGKLRCQGPFSHPIMAGLFWASVLPWLAAAWFRNVKNRLIIAVTSLSIMLIIVNTASSTPVMAVLLCVVGFAFFRFRRFMPLLRWLVLFVMIGMQLVMEKGVWHILARVNIFGGSTGWHRYHLIDEAINHLGEWWLVGTTSTTHWGLGLEDVTNQYVLEGVRGGLLGMLLFIGFIVALFHVLGKALRNCETNQDRWVLWSAGVLLFMHMLSFLSASYFGQMVTSFYLFAGMTTSLATMAWINKESNIESKTAEVTRPV